jgi:hypothetical protein
MTPVERALHTLGGQLRFEIAQSAARVAAAGDLSEWTRERVEVLARRRDGAVAQIRDTLRRAAVDPALLDSMRRLYASELEACAAWESRLEAAGRREEDARAELAQLRGRDRLVERGLQQERRREAGRRSAAEAIAVDEMWLRHERSAPR